MIGHENLRNHIENAAKAVDTAPLGDWTAPYTGPLPQTIDHTLLKLDTDETSIDRLCTEAINHSFKTVCVRPPWVSRAVHNLHDTNVGVACVVGFHEGTYPTADKVAEAATALQAGATELDMVMNYPLLQQGHFLEVLEDVSAVRKVAPGDAVLKVILETSQLSRFDIVAGCVIAELAGANFVKTSTGFNGPGATIENVRLMKAAVGNRVMVKASGGVRTLGSCEAMIRAGAHRIGTSSGVVIMESLGAHPAKPLSTDEGAY